MNRRFYKHFFIFSLLTVALNSCEEEEKKQTLFELLDNTSIGISFSNDLNFTNDFNVYKYRNYYNGGGVALGDVNNDGFLDIYLTANQLPNRLYINQGDFTFKDITASAGVAGEKAWAPG